ncbi:hypothetical protein MSAN_00728000 [Mycena sanguinolenta]|uniref:Uncharacterized protein n=1 Tax=Mycena sanguinolenta TaxID=230812 RepID=A0A8H6Z834_9AGAR|nr:hypothetical protein MSAN_00728000 [Mycena sanguinolenta]
MQPLTRQESRTSIFSWWSDRNPGLQGPTVNIHTMAKPLLRWMYHQQALELIAEHRDDPLSGATLEIYCSYFPWDYVWRSTKAAILWDLVDRATFEDDARTIVNSEAFSYITEMLGTPDEENLGALYRLLFEKLVLYESTASVIWQSQVYVQLVRLMRDEDADVVLWAISTLTEVAHSPECAQAVVEARFQDHVLVLLDSPYVQIRQWTCQLISRLAKHEPPTQAVLELKPCKRLVSLLRDEHPEVVEWAANALVHIAHWEEGAQAIIDADSLAAILALVEPPNLHVPEWACYLVGTLAGHESIVPAILKQNLCVPLVSYLCGKDSGVIAGAAYALSQLARWPDGAQAVVTAKALNPILALLESPNSNVLLWTHEIAARLLEQECTEPALMGVESRFSRTHMPS